MSHRRRQELNPSTAHEQKRLQKRAEPERSESVAVRTAHEKSRPVTKPDFRKVLSHDDPGVGTTCLDIAVGKPFQVLPNHHLDPKLGCIFQLSQVICFPIQDSTKESCDRFCKHRAVLSFVGEGLGWAHDSSNSTNPRIETVHMAVLCGVHVPNGSLHGVPC